jgi:hypothetical protein
VAGPNWRAGDIFGLLNGPGADISNIETGWALDNKVPALRAVNLK